jgi:tRNA(His) 5'-end guanylyltransferase
MKKDSLGDRMKGYEFQYSGQQLLPLIPIVARMDGKAFHTFTAGLKRPFDERLSRLMVATTKFLVQETNARVGYTQSDGATRGR